MSLPTVLKDIISNKKYIFVEEWGQGAYGKCLLVKECTSQGFYVCKLAQRAGFQRETDIHRKLKNEHIVELISAFTYQNLSCMILEPCENGTVELLLKCRKSLTHPEVRCITTQVARGLEYLHERLIIHRDIKLSNLLLTGTMIVKIADFGLSDMLSHSEEKRLSICGTASYIAPEVRAKVGYGFEVDIWALGCVVYALLDGKMPFSKDASLGAIESFVSSKTAKSAKIGLSAWNFLKTVFNTNPPARPTAKTMLMHSYFQKTFTPERLTPFAFLKNCSKPSSTMRVPLTDITNEAQANLKHKSIQPTSGKENVSTKNEKPSFTMSLRAQKTIQTLPSLENIWIDHCAKLAKRMLDELRGIRVLHCDWELDGQVSPFTYVDRWAASLTAFAYQINTGALGIDFAQGDFFYRSAEGEETFYGPSCYQTGLDSKTSKILSKALNFVEAFMGNLSSTGPKTDSKEDTMVVVKKCYLPKEESSRSASPLIAFLLSNGSCQVSWRFKTDLLLICYAGQLQQPRQTDCEFA